MDQSSRAAQTAQPLHPLLATRHSTRALDPEARITPAQLTAILEAARWAPSAGNTQPARFIVGTRDSVTFKRVLATLRPGNQKWARHASALVVGVRLTANEKGELRHAAYDLGQAMAHLTVQAAAEGLTVRQMGGFDADALTRDFALPENLVPTVVAAVGTAGDIDTLPEDVRGPDLAPRRRAALSDVILFD